MTTIAGFTQIEIGRVQQAFIDMEVSSVDIMVSEKLATFFAGRLSEILNFQVSRDTARSTLHEFKKVGKLPPYTGKTKRNPPKVTRDELNIIIEVYAGYGIPSDRVLIHGRHISHLRQHLAIKLERYFTDDEMRELIVYLRNSGRLPNLKEYSGQQLPLFDHELD